MERKNTFSILISTYINEWRQKKIKGGNFFFWFGKSYFWRGPKKIGGSWTRDRCLTRASSSPGALKTRRGSGTPPLFCDAAGLFNWYRCFYLQRWRVFVSPLCRILCRNRNKTAPTMADSDS